MATDARKHVNELDNATSAKAVDALLSYETVTLFNNQVCEAGVGGHWWSALWACRLT